MVKGSGNPTPGDVVLQDGTAPAARIGGRYRRWQLGCDSSSNHDGLEQLGWQQQRRAAALHAARQSNTRQQHWCEARLMQACLEAK
jgi:hypothetical protein